MTSSPVLGLGLESSCDETAASVVVDGREVLSNIIFSQIDLHREYSGVVPEIASRAHLEAINSLVHRALQQAGCSFNDLSYVAATNRPGLTGSLLIGMQSAKAVSFVTGVPLVGINHLEAHLYAPFLEGNEPEYPFLGLLVSGGNTALYRVDGIGAMTLLGKTSDDAVGEAYDKVSKFLGLGYPGGPIIEKKAGAAKIRRQFLPKILADSESIRFSYSGIKTAVINYIKKNPDTDMHELAWAFQERALEVLDRQLLRAVKMTGIRKVVIAGGVAANGRLRERMRETLEGQDVSLLIPSPLLCTDNAAMIAGLAFHYYRKGENTPLSEDVYSRV